MKNLIVTLTCFLTLILLQSCEKDTVPPCEDCNFTCLDENEPDVITNSCITDWECEFRVTAQSKVDLNEFNGRTSGDKNVFQMISSTEGDAMIADDEFTDVLVFELAESQTSFSVSDEELADLQVHFKRLCFCENVSFQAITSGCLQGEKQTDGTWRIQGNLTIPGFSPAWEVKIDAEFGN